MTLLPPFFRIARPLLHQMDAETAHWLTIRALKVLPCRLQPEFRNQQLSQTLFGLKIPNPVGLAPGFDKNAEVPDAMLSLGFGFVEVGTLTPRPQAGNPRPRLFRLVEDQAVINRMGFNNEGHEAALTRLRARKSRGGIIGINIGANKDSIDRIADYVSGISAFAGEASYITANISSPNTPGLRGLQSAAELEQLLSRLNQARAVAARPVPLLLKIAPDLGDEELSDIATCCGHGAVDGVIISNTTLSRPGLRSRHAAETGGLSGRPLRSLATRQLAKFRILTKGTIPLVGVGGIEDAASAIERLEAGASLLQVYSALVYKGPALVSDINAGIAAYMARHGFDTLAEFVGCRAQELSTTQVPADSA